VPIDLLEKVEMTDKVPGSSRRRFIKLTVAGIAAAPFAGSVLGPSVHAADLVSESNPQAQALGYKADAAKATNRKDPKADCGNCSFFSGKPGAADGPCSILGGSVSAKGWCTAWVKKAG
jgi:hypothetical protein